MALANDNDVTVGFDNNIEAPIGHEYKTATLVDKDTPFIDMLNFIEGSEWEVTYFNQLKAEEDILSNLDIQTPASLQAYNKISKLILKVQTPIDTGDLNNINGSSIIIGNIVPQEEDLLFVKLAGGRPALLRVNEVSRETYTLSSVFKISYVLDSWVDTDPTRYNDLLTKISKEFYFDKEYMTTESSPILLKSVYEFKKEVTRVLYKLPEYYLDMILDNITKYLVKPDETLVTLDLPMSEFFYSMHNVIDTPKLLKVNLVKLNYTEYEHNIFNALIAKDKRMLRLSKRYYNTVNLGPYIHHSGLGGEDNQVLNLMRYSGVRKLVDLTEEITGVPHSTPSVNIAEYTGVLPVVTGEYLFTDNLYTLTDDSLSTIERLVYNYFEGNVLSDDDVQVLLDTYTFWSRSEIYFYLPIMIFILKEKLRYTGEELYRYVR